MIVESRRAKIDVMRPRRSGYARFCSTPGVSDPPSLVATSCKFTITRSTGIGGARRGRLQTPHKQARRSPSRFPVRPRPVSLGPS